METKTIDVIIPTYRPGREFVHLLERLEKQSRPVRKILVMNTEKEFWNPQWEKSFPSVEVHHLHKAEFDHGGTRKRAAELTDAGIMVFMTQDALPADRNLIQNLAAALESDPEIGAAYARQLPNTSCSYVERYTRAFNYPEESSVKSRADLPRYGIKTFFCSNVCAAYKKEIYEELGGFTERTVFNEDMIYAGTLIQNGYSIAYAADARVIHSHNYSCMQQFRRNFDLGVSQAEYPQIFDSVSSEGEGVRLVKKTLGHLCRKAKFWMIPGYVMQTGFKYAGYLAGKNFRRLPEKVILRCTMNRDYWKN
ncbi:MAG TPA: glycosyltransferase [Candidatus Blautia faecipullorum]|nr:glycosyltransferase [Candidatus Blautia faecipullorum]